MGGTVSPNGSSRPGRIVTPRRGQISPRSGLWIPRPTRSEAAIDPSRVTTTYVSYEEVYDDEPTWDDTVQLLSEFSIDAILANIGRLSGAVHAAQGADALDIQSGLCRWLFEDEASAVLRAADDLLREVRSHGSALSTPVVIFFERQLVNAAKLALLEVPFDNELQTDSSAPLGRALLAVSDLMRQEETLGELPSQIDNQEDRREWGQFMLVNGRFQSFGNPMYELARSWELYLTDRPHLCEEPEYMDLPAIFEEVTGLPLDQFAARSFAVYSNWAKGADKDTGELPNSLEVETAYTSRFDFSEEEEEAFWPLVSAPAEQVRGELRDAGCGNRTLKPYHALPFEKHPVVRHKGQAHCASTLLLARRVSTGLRWIIRDRLESEEEGKRFFDYLGLVYEDYVSEVVSRIFDGRPERLVEESTLRERAGEGVSICDGVIVYPDAAIPYEVKASRMGLDARAEGDWNTSREFLERVFLSAVEQTSSTIDLVEEGVFEDLGLDPNRIGTYLPVVITEEPVAVQPPIYNLIATEIADRGYLTHPKVEPLQHLGAQELAIVESATNRGTGLRRMLEDRVGEGGHMMPFKNWAFQSDKSLLAGPNEYLQGRFQELGDTAVEYLRSREREGQEGGGEE